MFIDNRLTIYLIKGFKYFRFKPCKTIACQKDKFKQLRYKMKNYFVLPVLLLSFLLLGSSQASAQAPNHPNFKPGLRGGKAVMANLEKIKKELELTDKQKSDINALKFETRKKIIDLKAALEKNKIEIHEMINSGKFDKENYLKLVEKSIKISGDIRYAQAETKTKIYDLLTDKQKEIFLKHAEHFLGMKEAVKDRIKNRIGR